MIEPDLAAKHDGVAGFCERAIAEHPIAIGKAGTDVAADIKPAPTVAGNEERRLRWDERVGGLRPGVRKQRSNSRDASEGADDWCPCPHS